VVICRNSSSYKGRAVVKKNTEFAENGRTATVSGYRAEERSIAARSSKNTSGEKRWIDWMRQVRPREIPYLTRVLMRTQRMMNAAAYLKEHAAAELQTPVIAKAS